MARQWINFLILLTAYQCKGSPDCDSFTDCESCTSHSSWLFWTSCRWCPCDQACHAFGSTQNGCDSYDDVTSSSDCPSKQSRESGCLETPPCDTNKDCESCVRHITWNGNSCRWCPLDRECHAQASLENSCRSEQNIESETVCRLYNKNYGKYDPKFAYLNTFLSAIAYSDEPDKCVQKIKLEGEFEIQEVIGRRCEHFLNHLSLFKYKECYAYTAISHSKKLIVLAFRGTDFSRGNQQLIDEMLSVLLEPKEPFLNAGEVQAYFKDAHDKLMPCAKESLLLLLKDHSDYEVVVTGHSLGGALASLAAMSLTKSGIVSEEKLSLYTFGMPRVGDKEYALNHDRTVNNSWRLVHDRDIVSHLPFCNLLGMSCRYTADGPYHHRTEIFYPDYYMTVNSPYTECHGDEDETCSDGLVTDNWCTDVDNCARYHKFYFEIQVGEYCDEMTSRHKRSDGTLLTDSKTSRMWHLFSDEGCRRIGSQELQTMFLSNAKLVDTPTKTHSYENVTAQPAVESDVAGSNASQRYLMLICLIFLLQKICFV